MASFSEISFSFLKDLDTNPIGKFGKLIEDAVESEAASEEKNITELMKECPDYPWEQEKRELVFGELWQVRELGATFLLVALNQSFETALIRALDEVFVDWPNQTPEYSVAYSRDKKLRRGSVMERLNAAVPNASSFDGLKSVEELRHIVNAWKHDGWVSESLAKAFPQWERFKPFENLDEHYARLKPGVVSFSAEVGRQLHKKWRILRAASRAS